MLAALFDPFRTHHLKFELPVRRRPYIVGVITSCRGNQTNCHAAHAQREKITYQRQTNGITVKEKK